MKVSSASTTFILGLSEAGARKPMPPAGRWAERRRVRRSSPGFLPFLDHHAWRDRASFSFSRCAMASWSGVERAPAALAAEPQKSMRASPADDLAACAMRAASASTRSWLAVPSASSRCGRAFPRFFREALPIFRPGSLGSSRRSPSSTPATSRRWSLAQARNRRQPSRKVLSPHRITPSIRLTMN